MRNMIRLGKFLVCLMVLTALAVFTPLIPTSSMEYADPIDHTDARVRTKLSDDDLGKIMRAVRRGRINSVYETVTYNTRSPLLSIDKADNGGFRPKARVEVRVGTICGPLCGSGEVYLLDEKNGEWFVVDVSEWIS